MKNTENNKNQETIATFLTNLKTNTVNGKRLNVVNITAEFKQIMPNLKESEVKSVILESISEGFLEFERGNITEDSKKFNLEYLNAVKHRKTILKS